MQKNFVYFMVVILVSFFTVQNTAAQTKLYDLSRDGRSVDFSPDGKHIVTGDLGGDVGLWKVSNGENIYRRSIGGVVKGVAFSPDGKFIVAGGANGRVKVIRLTIDGKKVRRSNLADDAKSINAVAYSTDGIHVAIGDDTGRAYLLNVNSGEWRWWRYRADNLYSVTFSPDGEYLATGDSDGYARIWKVDSWWRAYVNAQSIKDVNIQSIKLGGNVRALTFSPNGRYLAADKYDSGNESVYIYDVVQGRGVQQIDRGSTTGRGITALAFSPDGRFIAIGNVDSKISIYWIGTEMIASVTVIKHAMTIQASESVEDLAWSPDSDLISDGKTVWRTEQSVSDNKPGIRLTLPDDLISEVAFGPNSTYFILNAQYPILTGASGGLSYGQCILTLDLPNVPDNTLLATTWLTILERSIQAIDEIDRTMPLFLFLDKLGISPFDLVANVAADVFLPNARKYFMFPLETMQEVRDKIQEEAIRSQNITLITAAIGTLPFAGDLGTTLVSLGVIELQRLFALIELVQSTMDPKIHLSPGIGDIANVIIGDRNILDVFIDFFDRDSRPNDRLRYLIYIPKRVEEIDIKVKQQYRFQGRTRELEYNGKWKLAGGTLAAPSAQLTSLADYPPFQMLPSEVQAYLLQHFGELMNTGNRQIPEETALLPNYPNPFNPETWIPYQLATSADVTVTIHAVDGTVVRTLALGHQPIGTYQGKNRAAYWDGKNALGELVASGVYFYTLTAGDFTATRKMLIKK